MRQFWLNYGYYFIEFEILIIIIIICVVHIYTGVVKKLDLMIGDIFKNGEVSFKVLNFDKFFNSQDLDFMRLSTITHIFFHIPGKKEAPVLYSNNDFLQQLKKVLAYRKFYKYLFLISLINLTIIIVMIKIYGVGK